MKVFCGRLDVKIHRFETTCSHTVNTPVMFSLFTGDVGRKINFYIVSSIGFRCFKDVVSHRCGGGVFFNTLTTSAILGQTRLPLLNLKSQLS